MSTWRDPLKNRFNVEVHVPGFDLNKSIGQAKRRADRRRAQQAAQTTTPAAPTTAPSPPEGPEVQAFAPGDPEPQVGQDVVQPPFELTL